MVPELWNAKGMSIELGEKVALVLWCTLRCLLIKVVARLTPGIALYQFGYRTWDLYLALEHLAGVAALVHDQTFLPLDNFRRYMHCVLRSR